MSTMQTYSGESNYSDAGADDFLLSLTPEQRYELVRPALEDIAAGRVYSFEEVFAEMRAKFADVLLTAAQA